MDGGRLFIGESFVEATEEYAQEYIERVVEVRSVALVLYSQQLCFRCVSHALARVAGGCAGDKQADPEALGGAEHAGGASSGT